MTQRAAALAGIVIAFILVACGGEEYEAPPTLDPTPGPPAVLQATKTASRTPTPAPTDGTPTDWASITIGELRALLPGTWLTFDFTGDEEAVESAREITSGWVRDLFPHVPDIVLPDPDTVFFAIDGSAQDFQTLKVYVDRAEAGFVRTQPGGFSGSPVAVTRLNRDLQDIIGNTVLAMELDISVAGKRAASIEYVADIWEPPPQILTMTVLVEPSVYVDLTFSALPEDFDSLRPILQQIFASLKLTDTTVAQQDPRAAVWIEELGLSSECTGQEIEAAVAALVRTIEASFLTFADVLDFDPALPDAGVYDDLRTELRTVIPRFCEDKDVITFCEDFGRAVEVWTEKSGAFDPVDIPYARFGDECLEAAE